MRYYCPCGYHKKKRLREECDSTSSQGSMDSSSLGRNRVYKSSGSEVDMTELPADGADIQIENDVEEIPRTDNSLKKKTSSALGRYFKNPQFKSFRGRHVFVESVTLDLKGISFRL